MKRSILAAFTVAGLSGLVGATAAHGQVINEVYPGGGSNTAGATYTRDFVELYNPGLAVINLTGYALQYASAAGTFSNTIVIFGAGSVIAPGDYLSIATGTAGTAGATLAAGMGAGNVTYVAPTSSASLSNTGGSVRLYNTATSTTVDVVGYGSATQGTSPTTDPKFETAVAPAPTSTATSLNRTNFVDTNNNSVDFTNMTPTPNGGTLSVVMPVPEPSTWAAVASGLGALALITRRRRLS